MCELAYDATAQATSTHPLHHYPNHTADPQFMKIERVLLENIRCFEHLEIDLGCSSALIIGDNGDGKSTVMRSLAMGLCDDSSAAALFRDLHGETVRSGFKEGRIEVDLRDGSRRFRTITEIKALKRFERVDQTLVSLNRQNKIARTLTQRTFPWSRIFAAGYGAGIRVQGTADYDYYLTVDALYPLFRYDAPLQNPELIVRRLVDAARENGYSSPRAARLVLTQIKALLKSLLQLEHRDQLDLTRTGITVRRGRSGPIELSSLGDGYRSTVTWILDLLSWWFLRSSHVRNPTKFTSIGGIVLVDEIEQHLHPRWQRNIMRLLLTSFPRVQFIAATHSPLVASGSEGVPVHRLREGGHDTVSPFGWLAEDVYEMMGLSSTRAKTFVTEVVEEFERLDKKRLRTRLDPREKARMAALRRRLRELPSSDPVRLTTELANLVQRARELGPNR